MHLSDLATVYRTAINSYNAHDFSNSMNYEFKSAGTASYLSPDHGSLFGGTIITIRGTGLYESNDSGCKFGPTFVGLKTFLIPPPCFVEAQAVYRSDPVSVEITLNGAQGLHVQWTPVPVPAPGYYPQRRASLGIDLGKYNAEYYRQWVRRITKARLSLWKWEHYGQPCSNQTQKCGAEAPDEHARACRSIRDHKWSRFLGQ